MSLAARPQHYYDDPVTFLGLRLSVGRLVLNDATPAMLAELQSLLWDTALRIEDGEMSLAARELRELERQRSEEHTSEIQSLMRTSYAVFCLKKKNNTSKD